MDQLAAFRVFVLQRLALAALWSICRLTDLVGFVDRACVRAAKRLERWAEVTYLWLEKL